MQVQPGDYVMVSEMPERPIMVAVVGSWPVIGDTFRVRGTVLAPCGTLVLMLDTPRIFAPWGDELGFSASLFRVTYRPKRRVIEELIDGKNDENRTEN